MEKLLMSIVTTKQLILLFFLFLGLGMLCCWVLILLMPFEESGLERRKKEGSTESHSEETKEGTKNENPSDGHEGRV